MLSFLLYILLLCLLLAGWALLTLVGYLMLRYRRGSRILLLAGLIVSALWGVTTFNVWYEGVILVEHPSLIPTLNSWAFVLITPLFYLYYRLQLTDDVPGQRQWRRQLLRHLFVPGALAVLYLVMTLVSPVHDKLVYSWTEFLPWWHSWWGLFRLGCYVLLAGQLTVYLPRLFGRAAGADKRVQHLRKEMQFVVSFCAVSVLCMLTPFYLFRLLYTVYILLLAGYLFYCSPYCRLAKHRLRHYLLPDFLTPRQGSLFSSRRDVPKPEQKQEPLVIFSPEKEAQLEQALFTHLHNPDLTLGMLAREVLSNETYLSRYFNRQLGMSFPEYVSHRRLREAEELLLHTDDTVTDISEKVGFQTLSAFYAAFGARHGMPPSHWRKQATAEPPARTPEPTPCGE